MKTCKNTHFTQLNNVVLMSLRQAKFALIKSVILAGIHNLVQTVSSAVTGVHTGYIAEQL